ncbi:MAG: hypothetical protein ACYC61_15500, partial [Isosphaeraceae bacterium]
MDQDRIIPARFDHREAAAGLRSLEQSGRTADDLAHAADSVVARFQRAHESIRAASRGFLELHRAARSAGDPGEDEQPGGTADHPPGLEDAAERPPDEPHDVPTHRPILGGPRPGQHDSPDRAVPRRPAAGGGPTPSPAAVPAADAVRSPRSKEGIAARAIEDVAPEDGTGAVAASDGRADVESPGPGQAVGRSLRITTSSQGPRQPSGEKPPPV